VGAVTIVVHEGGVGMMILIDGLGVGLADGIPVAERVQAERMNERKMTERSILI
jgi:hypothetical protein